MRDLIFNAMVNIIRENLKIINEKMMTAVEKSGRKPDEIKLLAVTKMVPIFTIKAAIEAGLQEFGENYPEQAVEKIENLISKPRPTWHMIGHIQSRKSKIVCSHFDWVHSIDSLKIAQRINRNCREINRLMPILLEVNLSGEDSKFGFKAWDEHEWEELLLPFHEIVKQENVKVEGLMSMPPFFDDPELTRPYYQRLTRLQKYLQAHLPEASWKELSIGTSFDYEVAIEEGATIIRLGTAIFGRRPF